MSVFAFFEVVLRQNPTSAALAAYDRYRSAVPAIIEQHGGRYLARAWSGEALEGDPAGDRFHLIEFPDAEAANAFWTSPEYAAVKDGRDEAASVRAIVIAPPVP